MYTIVHQTIYSFIIYNSNYFERRLSLWITGNNIFVTVGVSLLVCVGKCHKAAYIALLVLTSSVYADVDIGYNQTS